MENKKVKINEVYVDFHIQKSGDGKSWKNAFKTIGEVFNKWGKDKMYEIHIPNGNYK